MGLSGRRTPVRVYVLFLFFSFLLSLASLITLVSLNFFSFYPTWYTTSCNSFLLFFCFPPCSNFLACLTKPIPSSHSSISSPQKLLITCSDPMRHKRTSERLVPFFPTDLHRRSPPSDSPCPPPSAHLPSTTPHQLTIMATSSLLPSSSLPRQPTKPFLKAIVIAFVVAVILFFVVAG